MGNLPSLSKKSVVEFGEYSEVRKGQFSMRSFRPYDMSSEDLRPILSREAVRRSWLGPAAGGEEQEAASIRGSATILGLEMDQESVNYYTIFVAINILLRKGMFKTSLQNKTGPVKR